MYGLPSLWGSAPSRLHCGEQKVDTLMCQLYSWWQMHPNILKELFWAHGIQSLVNNLWKRKWQIVLFNKIVFEAW